jgi:hypothetical protein
MEVTSVVGICKVTTAAFLEGDVQELLAFCSTVEISSWNIHTEV